MAMKAIYRKDFKNVPPLVCDEGKLKPNPALVNTYPYWLTLDDIGNDSFVTLLGSSTARRQMTNDSTGTVDLRNLKHIATSNEYLVNILDTQNNRFIMNQPIHADTIFGTGPFPFKIPCPLILYPNNSLVIDFQNLSLVPNTIRLAFDGGPRFHLGQYERIMSDVGEATRIGRPYFYTTDTVLQLPASGVQVSINMSMIAESDFYLQRITTHQTGAFRIRMTGPHGFAWGNSWVHSTLFGGNAINHLDFEQPMFIKRSTILRFDLINLMAPFALNDVFITFSGVNYYYQE